MLWRSFLRWGRASAKVKAAYVAAASRARKHVHRTFKYLCMSCDIIRYHARPPPSAGPARLPASVMVVVRRSHHVEPSTTHGGYMRSAETRRRVVANQWPWLPYRTHIIKRSGVADVLHGATVGPSRHAWHVMLIRRGQIPGWFLSLPCNLNARVARTNVRDIEVQISRPAPVQPAVKNERFTQAKIKTPSPSILLKGRTATMTLKLSESLPSPPRPTTRFD